MSKYRYIGQGERHLPKHGLTVYEGQIVETDQEINNPEFQEVKPEIRSKNRKRK